MSGYYPAGCETLPAHSCDPCDDGEMGRVRSVAFIKKDFVFTDPTDATEWQTGITAGSIIVIPETNGTFDGGKPKDGTGYGDADTTYMGSEFSLKFKDPNYKSNILFYNALRKSRSYKMAFRTQTLVHLVEKPCSIRPTNPVAEGLDTTVVWEVEVKWVDQDSPLAYDTPDGVFECYIP